MQEALRGIQWRTYGETILNPVSFSFVMIAGILLLFLPRRYAIIPFVMTALFVTSLQRIVIFSLDFNMLRIIVLFGVMRVAARSEYRLITLTLIDKLIILDASLLILMFFLKSPTTAVFISCLGVAYTALGIYFLCRIFLQNIDDITIAVKAVVLMSIPVALFMVNELVTQKNFFSVLGGVPEITKIRGGRLRCQGAFSHPIMAGTFGGSMLPMAVGLWFLNGRNKLLSFLGVTSSTIITYASASSGPFLSYFAGLIALFGWRFRAQMRKLFWAGLTCLVGLHIIMNGPVWSLIGRASVVGGSDASHRVRLISKTVEYFHEWWLMGTYGSGHWGWGLEDVTNMYVRQCIAGGLSKIVVFVLIIALCFKTIGRAVKSIENPARTQRFIWAMGACLFSHTVAMIGVSYFGQSTFFWYLILAVISSLSSTLDFDAEMRFNTE